MENLLFGKDLTGSSRERLLNSADSFVWMNEYITSMKEGKYVGKLILRRRRTYMLGRKAINIEKYCVLIRKDTQKLGSIETVNPALFFNFPRKRLRINSKASGVTSSRILFQKSCLSLEYVRKACSSCQLTSLNSTHVHVSGNKGLPTKMIESSHLSDILEDASLNFKDYCLAGGNESGKRDTKVSEMVSESQHSSLPLYLRLVEMFVPEVDREELIGDLCERVFDSNADTVWYRQYFRNIFHCFSTVLSGIQLRTYYFSRSKNALVVSLESYANSRKVKKLKSLIRGIYKDGSTEIYPRKEEKSDDFSLSLSKSNPISRMSHNDQVAIVAALVFTLVCFMCGPLYGASVVKHGSLIGAGISTPSN